jgi:hypothetical protein
MEAVGRHEPRVGGGMAGDRRDVRVAGTGSFRLLGVDGVEVIDLGADLRPVAAGGEWRDAPIGDGNDQYALRILPGERDGSPSQHDEFLSILLGLAPAVLIVDADQQRHERVRSMWLRRIDG